MNIKFLVPLARRAHMCGRITLNMALALIGMVFCAAFLLFLPRLAHGAPSMTEPVTHLIVLVSDDVRALKPQVMAWHTSLEDCHQEVRKRNRAAQASGPLAHGMHLVCVAFVPEML